MPQAIGYVTPDWTSLDPNSHSHALQRPQSSLLVAGIYNGTKAYTPTAHNIEARLEKSTEGTNLTPPTNAAQGANPALWVPVIQKTSAGYPIVGYTTLDLAAMLRQPGHPQRA